MKQNKITSFLSRLFYRIYNVVRNPLVFMIVMIAFIYSSFFLTEFRMHPDIFDAHILTGISVISALIVITMLATTKPDEWTALNAGLLGTFWGLSLLYALTVYVHYQGLFRGSEEALMFVRSVLIVSPVWVLTGILIEAWYFHRIRIRAFAVRIKHAIVSRFRKFRRK